MRVRRTCVADEGRSGVRQLSGVDTFFLNIESGATYGHVSGLALFDPATAGIILLPLLVYHFLQLVLAAPLATRLAQGTTD